MDESQLPVFHGVMGAETKKNLLTCMAVPPAPVRIPNKRPLAPSVTSATSIANEKGDNEMIPGAVACCQNNNQEAYFIEDNTTY